MVRTRRTHYKSIELEEPPVVSQDKGYLPKESKAASKNRLQKSSTVNTDAKSTKRNTRSTNTESKPIDPGDEVSEKAQDGSSSGSLPKTKRKRNLNAGKIKETSDAAKEKETLRNAQNETPSVDQVEEQKEESAGSKRRKGTKNKKIEKSSKMLNVDKNGKHITVKFAADKGNPGDVEINENPIISCEKDKDVSSSGNSPNMKRKRNLNAHKIDVTNEKETRGNAQNEMPSVDQVEEQCWLKEESAGSKRRKGAKNKKIEKSSEMSNLVKNDKHVTVKPAADKRNPEDTTNRKDENIEINENPIISAGKISEEDKHDSSPGKSPKIKRNLNADKMNETFDVTNEKEMCGNAQNEMPSVDQVEEQKEESVGSKRKKRTKGKKIEKSSKMSNVVKNVTVKPATDKGDLEDNTDRKNENIEINENPIISADEVSEEDKHDSSPGKSPKIKRDLTADKMNETYDVTNEKQSCKDIEMPTTVDQIEEQNDKSVHLKGIKKRKIQESAEILNSTKNDKGITLKSSTDEIIPKANANKKNKDIKVANERKELVQSEATLGENSDGENGHITDVHYYPDKGSHRILTDDESNSDDAGDKTADISENTHDPKSLQQILASENDTNGSSDSENSDAPLEIDLQSSKKEILDEIKETRNLIRLEADKKKQKRKLLNVRYAEQKKMKDKLDGLRLPENLLSNLGQPVKENVDEMKETDESEQEASKIDEKEKNRKRKHENTINKGSTEFKVYNTKKPCEGAEEDVLSFKDLMLKRKDIPRETVSNIKAQKKKKAARK